MRTVYLILLCLTSTYVMAQTTVSGVVKSDDGETLPGAAIQEIGTTNGTITNIEGTFNLTVENPRATLSISFLGFETQMVELNNRTRLDIILKVDVTQLQEIVVVGYGTLQKSDLTGSVTSVKVEDNVARQSNTVDQLLMGRSAGVQVVGTGQPGAGVSVRIRGTNSLRGNNEPLYVVDGMIVSSAGEDASATAIYGSRGANGVVLITTKQGVKGKMRVNGYATVGFTEITSKIDVLDGVGYAQYRNEVATIDNINAPFDIRGDQVFQVRSPGGFVEIDTISARFFDWQDEIYTTAIDKTAGLFFTGGGKSGTYYVSLGYRDQQGIVENSGLQSGDFRINITQNVNDKLKIVGRLNAFYSQGNFAQDGDRVGGSRSFVRNVLAFNPVVGSEVEDLDNNLGNASPLNWINNFEDASLETRFFGNLAATYQLPLKGLSYRLELGGNIRNKTRERFYGPQTFIGNLTNGSLSTAELVSKAYQVNNLITYRNTSRGGHRLNVVLGTTYDYREVSNQQYRVEDFTTTSFTTDQPFFGQVVALPLRVNFSHTKLFSVLGRANYSYKNKYTLTATLRSDGVSKFSEENRFSYFPSFAVAWNAHNENFMKGNNFFSDLKVRASWGQIGNQGIRPFQTGSNYSGDLYATPGNGVSVGFVPQNIPNQDLKWEITEQYNVGVDFGLFQNRITGTVEAYLKNTKDLLLSQQIRSSAGFNTVFLNAGEILNHGIELSLSTIAIEKNEMTLEISGNLSINRNEIVSLDRPADAVFLNGEEQQRAFYLGNTVANGNFFRVPANIFMEGQPIGLFFGFETDGIYQTGDEDIVNGAQPGDVKIIDQNGDGLINQQDRTIIGDPNPDFTYGLNVSFNYKRFSASVLVNGTYGNDIANGNLIQLTSLDGLGGNVLPAAYHNAWRPNAPSNTYPRVGYDGENQASAITDRIIEDGSFMRLNNVTIGYDLPVEKTFSNVNLYVSGKNLLTLTNYSGYDPELNSFLFNGGIIGVDWNSFPNTRSIILGINISF